MPSPFTSAERNKLFQIAGIPPSGQTFNVTALVIYPLSQADNWQPTYNNGDLSAIVTKLDIQLAACDTDTGNAVREAFPAWDSVKFSEIEITSGANGAAGPSIFSAKKKKEAIRLYISDLIGFYIPAGGYLHEMEAVYGKSLSEFRRGGGDRT